MKFSEVMAQTLIWLEREGRVSYRALKREFAIDDEYLEDIKAEVIKAKKLAKDEDGEVLVWVGKAQVPSAEFREQTSPQPPTPDTQSPAAERRQITVLFCDLVGSTALSAQLDPEDYRAVVQAYQAAATAVIAKHQGHLAQHWGDGLLVYFGYPTAHEDDARRAVRTGLEIIQAVQKIVSSPLASKDLSRARQLVWPVSGNHKERKPKRTSSCPKFTTGSPKALTRRICKKRRRCLMN